MFLSFVLEYSWLDGFGRRSMFVCSLTHESRTEAEAMEWTFKRGAWTFGLHPSDQVAAAMRRRILACAARRSPTLAISRKSLRTVAPPVLRWRMVVHLAKGPRKIELIGESKLIAYLLDRQVRAVE